jgi:hypothetical protein
MLNEHVKENPSKLKVKIGRVDDEAVNTMELAGNDTVLASV